jgi:hypothetical protein
MQAPLYSELCPQNEDAQILQEYEKEEELL